MTYNKDKKNALITEAKQLLGDSCVVCYWEGVINTEDLNFDHVFPWTKLFNISQGTHKKPKVFWAEVAKCQLLCEPHHRAKCAVDGSKKSGEEAGMSKLTDSVVMEMRRLYDLGQSSRAIAKQFGVDAGTAWRAITGETWAHLEGVCQTRAETPPNGKRLRELDVKYIRALSELGHSNSAIGEEFGVSRATVSRIVNRVTWKHVT